MSKNNPIKFAVIQSGYAVFGAGTTENEAYEDAARWMEPDENGPFTADRAAELCVVRPVDGDFYLLERSRDPDTFDSYLRNQGGFTLRDGEWFSDVVA